MTRWLFIVYLTGVAAFGAYRFAGWLFMRRLLARSRRLRQGVLLQSSDVTVPVALGVWRPAVLVPSDWRDWGATPRRAAMAHEFEHIRRRDAWTLSLARWATSLLWFHPLVWWVARKTAELAEMACDARALETVRDPERYSKILVEFAAAVGRKGRRASIPGLAFAGAPRLDRRIDQIFASSQRKLRRLRRPALTAAIMTEVAAKPFAEVQAAVIERLESVPGAAPLLSAVASAAESLTPYGPALQESQVIEPPGLSMAEVQAFFDKECRGCHPLEGRGWMAMDFDLTHIPNNIEPLEKALLRLRAGLEPTAGPSRPDPSVIDGVVRWVETEIDRKSVPRMPAPGPHRLNRSEYANAIRDILGLEINPALILPADPSDWGFDTIASALELEKNAEAFAAAAKMLGELAVRSESRQKFVLCRPENAAEAAPCAARIIRNLASRAFRRPASEAEIEEFLDVYRASNKDWTSENYYFDRATAAVVQRILADRRFLYRTEAEPADIAAGQSYRISDLELASRLSFFLWSSVPDDRLIDLASRGQLKNPAILEQETRRMLKDPRAWALTANFASLWLQLPNLREAGPLPQYPDFNESLSRAMRQEVELFFNSIVEEDRNVVDLITADYTFLNEQLARHYGVSGVTGSTFRRTPLGADLDVRRGLLGKGAILTVTSRPTRTSVVDRGLWVDRKLLGVHPMPPPPDVPALPPLGLDPAMRDVMEKANSITRTCNQCHRLIDPPGIALENFDRAGKWRLMADGKPIDAATALMDGTKIDGPAGLRQALVARSDQFVQSLTQELLTYGLGRGVEYFDMPAVRSITRNARRENNRFSAIVLAIVKSDIFQKNSKN
jgi:hypothetical protein